jgi:hypothetical protein
MGIQDIIALSIVATALVSSIYVSFFAKSKKKCGASACACPTSEATLSLVSDSKAESTPSSKTILRISVPTKSDKMSLS